MSNKTNKDSKNRTKSIKEKIESKCNGTMYDIVMDIIIPSIGIVATSVIAIFIIMVYIKANKLSEEANIINRKNEPLLYYLTNSNEMAIYNIEYNGEEIKIPCEAHELKVEQGVIDEIKNYNI